MAFSNKRMPRCRYFFAFADARLLLVAAFALLGLQAASAADPWHIEFEDWGSAILPQNRSLPLLIYFSDPADPAGSRGMEMRRMAQRGAAVLWISPFTVEAGAVKSITRRLERFLAEHPSVDAGRVVWIFRSSSYSRIHKLVAEGLLAEPALMVFLEDARTPVPLRARAKAQILSVEGRDVYVGGKPMESREPPTIGRVIDDLTGERVVLFAGVAEYCMRYFGQPAVTAQPFARQKGMSPLMIKILCLSAGAGLLWWAILRAAATGDRLCHLGAWTLAGILSLALAAAVGVFAIWKMEADGAAAVCARHFLTVPSERADYDYLRALEICHGQSVETLLLHLKLAGRQRDVFYRALDPEIYRAYVLSPVIPGGKAENLDWRWVLWESLAPRVRRTRDPEAAAKTIVTFLREQVVLGHSKDLGILDMWEGGGCCAGEFERLYVAGLRSAGIAARLDNQGRANFFDGEVWRSAPRPLFEEVPSPSVGAEKNRPSGVLRVVGS